MSIQSLAFNENCTLMTAGTDRGFIIYTLSPLEKKKNHEFADGGVGLVKIFKKSNIVIWVGGGEKPIRSKHILIMWDIEKESKNTRLELDFKEPIKNAIIIKDKIVVVLRKKITIVNWDGVQQGLKTTYNNDHGICVISAEDKRPTIATLGLHKGQIAIWRFNMDSYKTIDAHDSNIVALAISRDGDLVATASEKGTVIKIWNTDTCEQVGEFRRGTMSSVIHDICFNFDGKLLGCLSGNGTVHIFERSDDPEKTKNMTSMLAGYKDWLPGYFSSQWGFKQIPINTVAKGICGFDERDVLHVATYDGKCFRLEGPDYNNAIPVDLHTNAD